MFGDSDERTPLLQEQFPGQFQTATVSETRSEGDLSDAYKQFCVLIGNDSADQPSGSKSAPPRDTLYHRALQHRRRQSLIYALTRALTNTLLLAQVVLGAALTGLGAADSPGWLITIFGAANTIIAGLVAFLKSRGQPMRARMFRDDLDRVVDEIENSATMWKGISQKIHGYDAIDTDDAVTVRSEVARLTRLFDRAVKTNTMNDPDHYGSGISIDNAQRGLRTRPNQPFQPSQPQPLTLDAATPAPIPISGPSEDPDASPATQAPIPTPSKDGEVNKDATPAPVEAANGTPIASDLVSSSPPASAPSAPDSSVPAPDNPQVSTTAPPLTSSPEIDASPATTSDVLKAKEKSNGQEATDLPTAEAPKSH